MYLVSVKIFTYYKPDQFVFQQWRGGRLILNPNL